jgi:lipopolysaccharide transport system ATP-binding protein
MSHDILVKVDSVSKKFCRSLRRSLWYGVCDIASELIPAYKGSIDGRNGEPAGSFAEPDASQVSVPSRESKPTTDRPSGLRPGEFWALHNVSFELRRGECLALIGRNGAGKTTLLKILNGLIKPDTGRVQLRGTVGAMIALGAGFNPILTGRENIYVAASLRGLSKKQTAAKLDEIIDFAEIGEFIEAPVQTYSSGMQVRLGFSVAISLNPDILLIDEVLAVGDMGFRHKAYNAIYKIIETAAVIFVSHSTSHVAKVCNRGMLMRKAGPCILSERVGEVIDAYLDEFESGSLRVTGSRRAEVLRLAVQGGSGPNAVAIEIEPGADSSRKNCPRLRRGDALRLKIVLTIDPEVRGFHISVIFSDMETRGVAQCSSVNARDAFENDSVLNCIQLDLSSLIFNESKYSMTLLVFEKSPIGATRGEALIAYEGLLEFQVVADTLTYGVCPIQLQGDWRQDVSSEFIPHLHLENSKC